MSPITSRNVVSVSRQLDLASFVAAFGCLKIDPREDRLKFEIESNLQDRIGKLASFFGHS